MRAWRSANDYAKLAWLISNVEMRSSIAVWGWIAADADADAGASSCDVGCLRLRLKLDSADFDRLTSYLERSTMIFEAEIPFQRYLTPH